MNLLCWLCLLSGWQDSGISAFINQQETVEIAISTTVLQNEEVRRYLKSGLTTSFQIRLRGNNKTGKRLSASTLVAIRYELWDEQFLVVHADENGQDVLRRFNSMAAFEQWWRSHQWHFKNPGWSKGDRIRIDLEVVPFSAREQEEARLWLSQSLTQAGTGSSSGNASAAGLGTSILNTLVATSVQRKILLRFQWKTDVEG